jgi:DNA (cytosine-5)-methyltransferase 1
MTGTRGGRVLSPAFVEWMMGLPAGWVTEVPGLTRPQQLAMLGNGVVPQWAAAAFGELAARMFHVEHGAVA